MSWTTGLIALRSNDDKSAKQYLQQAVTGFLENNANPAVWSALALCAGAYALALARTGDLDGAKRVVAKVMPVLRIHGDKPMMVMLNREVLSSNMAEGR